MFGATNIAPAHFFAGSSSIGILQQLINIGGLTFSKDYQSAGIDADYSLGAPTATFTATRSASAPATYVDASGVIQLVSTSDIPRFQQGYYDTTGFHSQKGVMMESASTNLAKNSYFSLDTDSDGLSNNWFKSIYAVATRNDISSISALSGAKSQKSSATYAGTESQYSVLLYNNTNPISNGDIITLSFYARGDFTNAPTGAGANKWFYIDFETITQDNVADPGVSRTFTQATTDLSPTIWRKFTFTVTVTGGASVFVFGTYFGQLANATPPAAGESAWIEIANFQVEKLSHATSFIPTTTAELTRGAESLSYAISNNRTSASESIFVKFAPRSAFANDGIERSIIETDADRISLRKTTTGTSVLYTPNETDNTGVGSLATTTLLANTSYIATGISYGETAGTNDEIYLNGTSEDTDTTNYTAPTLGTNFYIGSNGNATRLNGIFQKVAIFSRALSSTEVSSVTNLLNT